MAGFSASSAPNRPDATGPLVSASGFCWAMGAVAPMFIMGVFGNILLYYLVYQVKIDPGAAAALLFAARMADLVFAPLVGLGSDHTHTRWGRRRPYLFAASILTPISWMILFIVPVTGAAAAIWALIGLLLVSGCYSLYNIPHVAMANEITDAAPARVRLMSIRLVFMMAAGLLGGLLPLVIQKAPGQQGYTIIAVLMAVGCGVPMLVSAVGTRNTLPRERAPPAKLSELFHGMGANTPFIVLTVGRMASLLLAAGQMPIMAFFLGIVMKLPVGVLATFIVASHVVALLSAPLWVRLIHRFGMQLIRDIVVVLGIIYCLSNLIAQPHEPIAGLLARSVIYGMILGGWQLVTNTMQADVIDYDYKLTGRRREGLFAAFFSFTDKTAGSLGVLGVGLLLSAVGFDKSLPKTQDQGPEVMLGLYVAMAVLPAMAYVITFIAYRFYKLDPGRGIYPDPPKARAASAKADAPTSAAAVETGVTPHM